MAEIEDRVRALAGRAAASDGTNVADTRFGREVESLLNSVYADIGVIRSIDLGALFKLFLIKTLYVERRSKDYGVLDYLSHMLTRYLYTRELGTASYYLSDIVQEMEHPSGHYQNMFEAYRRFGDNALFVAGVFAHALKPRRRGRGRLGFVAPVVDQSYFATAGSSFYRMAARHELAEVTAQRQLLEKLAEYFPIYREALAEASERYILGFDMPRIADLMLDSINSYRRTGESRYLEDARKYAALLKIEEARFPATSVTESQI
jgi:hypothetical protein